MSETKETAGGCFTLLVIAAVAIWGASSWLGDSTFLGNTFDWLNKGRMKEMLNSQYSNSRRVESIIEIHDEKDGEKTVIYEFRQVPPWHGTASAEKMRGSDTLVHCFDGWRVLILTPYDQLPTDFSTLKEGWIQTYGDRRWTKCNGYAMEVFKHGPSDSTQP